MSGVRVVTHQSCQSKVGYFDQVVFTDKAVASCQIPEISTYVVIKSDLVTFIFNLISNSLAPTCE